MPKLLYALPSYRRHPASGQAFVCLDGKKFYLGKYESPESRTEYNRLIDDLRTLSDMRGRPTFEFCLADSPDFPVAGRGDGDTTGENPWNGEVLAPSPSLEDRDR